MEKIFVALMLIAAVSAQSFDPSKIETKKLFVPENPEEFMKAHGGVIEQQREPRIGNGINATEGQFPYALRVRIFDTTGDIFVCSGVIISASFILTVRHCFDPVLTYGWFVI